MEIKMNTIPKKINPENINVKIIQPNQLEPKRVNTTKNNNQYNNNFFGVFGVQSKDIKNKKKKNQKRIDCKTPDKKDLENNNEDLINMKEIKDIKTKKRCKTPFSLKNIFKSNKEGKKKDKDKYKDNKDKEKDSEKNLKKEKSKPELINKKPILKYYDPFTEKIALLDGEGNTYEGEFQRKDLEIKIVFNDNNFQSFHNIHFTSNYFSFPQYLIHKVRYNSDSKNTIIILKDYRSFKIQTKDDEFYKKINFNPQARIDFFKYAYLYYANQEEKKVKYPINGWEIYNPLKEFQRQGVPFGMEGFSLSQINKEYKICETYPALLILPSHYCNESSIFKIASCRIKNRFPALTYVYTHPKNENIKSFLYRSAQVNTGFIFSKKTNYEIEYINEINKIGDNKEGFIFYDCRPYLNAKANSLKGAGIDDTSQYKNCKDLIFGCIENIHAVRKALKKALEKTNYGNATINTGKLSFNTSNNNLKKFLSKFEESKWLEYLSDIICGANLVVNKMLSRINVICHCSDGWDRTSQICSLVQIILDPYFRTFEGFAVLIEKDWVSFGHQFAVRNGCDCRPDKKKEKSPIFIQFLHAIYQIMEQYPNAFEFGENLLLFLSEEIYSNKFGTFLFNCEKELNENDGKEVTLSIWSEIMLNKKKYMNPYYKYIKEPLLIKGEVQYLIIWKKFFYKYLKIGLVKEGGEVEMNSMKHMENLIFKQRNSIIELMNILKENGLEKKMVNNEFYNIYKEYLDS